MDQPIFPKAFLKHCPKVLEAKDWHDQLGVEQPPNIDSDYAECAFINAGLGMKCENCDKFLTRPFLGHKVDEEFLPQIEDFYRKLEEYEKWKREEDRKYEASLVEQGAGI